jgi:enoyl-CoA hydratase/carnithine racemase
MDTEILLTTDPAGRTATLLINRPARRNALTVAMWQAIPRLVAEAEADTAVRVLFVRGARGVFAAGADIAEMPQVYATHEAALANDEAIQGAMTALEDCRKPVIALIEGPCVGGGCGIALACDLRIAATGSRFGVTPARLGLVYGAADARRLVAAVGMSVAKDILFTGRLLEADEAARVGLVDRLVAPDLLEAEAATLAGQIAAASPWSVQGQKQILKLLRGGDDAAPLSRRLFGEAFMGEHFKEGFAAFTGKRPPVFPDH